MHTWSRRWFVLNDKFLFMFLKEEDAKSADCITLDEHMIVEPPVDLSDPKKVYFDIVTDSNKSPAEVVLSLCAESEDEKKGWLRALKRALYADKGGALFSQSLEEILLWEKQAGRCIPFIITECVEYLYKNALKVEGIFRLPGRQSVIKDIISRFERGQKVNFEQEQTDVHAVASVLKAFLRDLPDSIIPCTLFQRFMNFALRFQDATSEQERNLVVEELANSMSSIPVDNYTILKYICHYLQDVGFHESENKMSMMNLGTVFGYNIIRHIDKENSELFLCTADLSQNLVYMLLKYYPKVFAIEYNQSGIITNNVPTADLLRMSHVLDVPPAIPVSLAPEAASHVAELEGIQLIVEQPHHDQAHCFTDSDFFNSPEVQGEIAKRPSLLRVMSQPAGSSRSLPASPTMNSSPIAPQRKSKLSRRGKMSERRHRPEGIVVLSGDGASNGAVSPRVHLSPGGVNSEDVIAALAKANLFHAENENDSSTKESETGQLDVPCTNRLSSTESEASTPDSKPVPAVRRNRTEGSDNHVRFLEQQVERLTDEKKRQRQQISQLQMQLRHIKEKYEQRIADIEMQHRSVTDRLQASLSNEKDSCAQAVECTINLKQELHRYQMQYGELPH